MIESTPDETAENTGYTSGGNAFGRILLFVILIGCALVGWNFFGPRSALAKHGWTENWDDAVSSSRASGKPALVLFTADWCPGCRQFESQVLCDPTVSAYLKENHTLVVVDLSDRTGPNNARAAEFGVRSIPSMVLYDKSGREISRSGGLPGGELIRWLRSHE